MEMNTLYVGDNVQILRKYYPDECVDLIYLDPPFGTGRIRKISTNHLNQNTELSFSDVFTWNNQIENLFNFLIYNDSRLINTLSAILLILGKTPSMAYIIVLTNILCELHRILKPTGSIYLHCDYHSNTYLKIILDSLFGNFNFRNEIVWHYTGGGRSKKYYSRKYDSIFFYTKSDEYTFNIEAIRTPYKPTSGYAKNGIKSKSGKKYLPNPAGTLLDDVWEIPIVNPMSHERVSYPTQKPQLLLERIILVSTNFNDIVLDPFCGCGTTLVSAHKQGRKWIGIDCLKKAVDLSRKRLSETGCDTIKVVNTILSEEPVSVRKYQLENIAKS
ncbi:MAG: site-specific DNA-methyltransferase [Planctomycetota bacterium]